MRGGRPHPTQLLDGRPQATAERCSTCILRPGGSSLVPPDVVRDLVERHRRVGAVVTCHQTLADIPGSCPEIGYSACRGFLDAYPDTLAALRSPLPPLSGWARAGAQRCAWGGDWPAATVPGHGRTARERGPCTAGGPLCEPRRAG
jgi:hypothetical protein